MVPPHLVRRVAAVFDYAIANCLRDTVGARGAPDDRRWLRALKQARLPVRLGGLGLTGAAANADAAWCGSWALCWARLQHLFPALRGVDLAAHADVHAATLRAEAAAAAASAPKQQLLPLPPLPPASSSSSPAAPPPPRAMVAPPSPLHQPPPCPSSPSTPRTPASWRSATL